jgi:hypothetical protein
MENDLKPVINFVEKPIVKENEYDRYLESPRVARKKVFREEK